MVPHAVNPILNVSSFADSVAWFKKLGWELAWHWGEPPNFGGVCAGNVEIFLCQGAQGGRGKGDNKQTFGAWENELADKGVWMSLWVDDVDKIYEHCTQQGLDVTWPPTNHPWNTREMHLRHPDGHVFRISQRAEE